MQGINYINRQTSKLEQEKVPAEGWLRWLYHNPLGKLALHSVVKRRFLSQWYGKLMDRPASRRRIPDFINDLQIDMTEAERSVAEFATFNEFFIRRLRPEARSIDLDSHTLVSPADGKVLAFPGISGLDSFFVKGATFSLESLLQDAALARKYAGGDLLIFRLAPVDYHRFHFPADGRISPSIPITGAYFSVSPYAVKNRIQIYWQNKREYSLLHTTHAGDILLCEVGATMVGSIVQNYTPHSDVRKGQEKGWFAFGGSTVIMLCEPQTVQIDTDILENTTNGYETTIKMGERLAEITG